MGSTTRNVLVLSAALVAIGGLVIACGSDESKFDDGKPNEGVFDNDASFGEAGLPQEDLYKNDPPPKWCGPGDSTPPPMPGGTEDCPDDKNKPGCGCTEAGKTAECWTGLRKHRGLGQCKDGVTKCVQKTEVTYAWGPCEGQVLPDPNAKKGKAACGCFSEGTWKIANLSPCTRTYCGISVGPGEACPPEQITGIYATSTVVDSSTGSSSCPSDVTGPPPPPLPSSPFSTSTLKVDCAGRFKLCYRIRAGNYDAPSANDCIVGEACAAEADYKTADVEQPWPDLPAWVGKDTACAKKWAETPANASAGYGEMIVKGESVRCDVIDDGAGNDLVFNRIKYCPATCRDSANAGNPECVSCKQSGQGTF